MAYATGLRLLAALNFALCLSVILAPICGPLGVWFLWQARSKEKEAEQRQGALQTLAEQE